MAVEAVFFDIDGTLVSFTSHKVSDNTLRALESLRQKGIKLFVATGRHKSEVLTKLPFKFDGYITLNGQYCFVDDEIVHQQALDKDDMQTLEAYMQENPFACMFVEKESVSLNYLSEIVEKLRKQLSFEGNIPFSDNRILLEKELFQLIAFVDTAQEHDLLKLLPKTSATRWHPDFIDVVPKGGSKKNGLEAFAKYFNLDLKNCLAFGDGENDLEMFHAVGNSFAMGNASDLVKYSADFVTTSVDEDGVAEGLKKMNLL